MVQPKPAASAISSRTCEPITKSFFGTHPLITQVPPMRYSSATITRAPYPAAIRAARTPPEPPPMTNRSTSNSAISHLDLCSVSAIGFALDFLAALAHFCTELGIHDFRKLRPPLVHKGHAGLNCVGF